MENDNPSNRQQPRRRLPQHEQLQVENTDETPQWQSQMHIEPRHGGTRSSIVSSITQRLLSGQVSDTGPPLNNNRHNLLQQNLRTMRVLEPTPIASHNFQGRMNAVPTFGVHDDPNLIHMDRNLQLGDLLSPLLPSSSQDPQLVCERLHLRRTVGPTATTSTAGALPVGSAISTTSSSQLPPQHMPNPSSAVLHQPYSSSSLINHQIDTEVLLANTTGRRDEDSRGQHHHHNLFVSESRGVGALTKIDHPLLLDSFTTAQSTDRRPGTSRRTTTTNATASGTSSLSNRDEMKQTSPPTKRKMYVDPSTTSESKSQPNSPTTSHVETAAASIQSSNAASESVPAAKRRRRSSRGRRKEDVGSKATSRDAATTDATNNDQVTAGRGGSSAERQASSTISSPQRFRSYQNEQWNKKFQELCDYRRQYGNCNVPSSFDRGLSKWVKRQRYQYKLKHKQVGTVSSSSSTSRSTGENTDAASTGSTTTTSTSTLTDERQHALEGIGFVWHSHESAWEERYEELRDFYNTNGHCNVPTNYPENTALPLWLQSQRRQYRLFAKGERSFMTEERIAKLSSIGFIFTPRGGASGSTTRHPSVSSSSSTK